MTQAIKAVLKQDVASCRCVQCSLAVPLPVYESSPETEVYWPHIDETAIISRQGTLPDLVYQRILRTSCHPLCPLAALICIAVPAHTEPLRAADHDQ
jgi:hypothetical protein